MLGFSHTLKYLGTDAEQIANQFPALSTYSARLQVPSYRYAKDNGTITRLATGTVLLNSRGTISAPGYREAVELSLLTGDSPSGFLQFYVLRMVAAIAQKLAFNDFVDDLALNVPTTVNDQQGAEWVALPFVTLTNDLVQRQNGPLLRASIAVVAEAPNTSDLRASEYLKENLLLLNGTTLRALAARLMEESHNKASHGSLLMFLGFAIQASEKPKLVVPSLQELNGRASEILGSRGMQDSEYNLLARLVPEFFEALIDFPLDIPAIEPVKVGGEVVFLGDEPVAYADLSGYSVRATFQPASGEAVEATYHWPELTAVPIEDRKVAFAFDSQAGFGVDANAGGTVSIDATAFDGAVLYQEKFAPSDRRLEHLTIEVLLRKPVALDNTNPVTSHQVRGKVVEISGKCPLGGLIIVLEVRRPGDEAGTWHVTGTATTDVIGGFAMPYPQGEIAEVRAIVSTQPDKPIAVDWPKGSTTADSETTIYLLLEAWNCEPAKEDDCECHGKGDTPRLPTQDDLVHSDKFSQDLGSGCVALTTPNRTLHERTYYAIVRTSDPDVANYVLKKSLITEADGFQRSIFELANGQKVTRQPVTFDNPIRWQDAPDTTDKDNHLSFYQSVTVATGHLLHYRSVLKADGYSLGDLIFSLPLAPGQKKQIISYDYRRSLIGAESQQLVQREGLNASIASDRVIFDNLSAGVSESLRGSSSASTGGVSAGLGVGGSIGPVSAVLGVAGGYAHSSSSASQSGARDTSQSFNELLRQSVMQSASAYREQNGTLIDAVNEGQQFAATTEVVANHNHCHSLTMLYFEVLRHFAVFQELADVEECLFVPLVMTNFSRENVHKWRDVLAARLLYRPSSTYLLSTFGANPLRKGFDANDRVLTNWANVDFPAGRYCDEAITDIHGSMTIRVSMPRPKTKYDRIFSFPIVTKTVSHEEFDLKTTVKSGVAAVVTGGLSLLFGGDSTTHTVTEQILVRAQIFDQFMQIDDNFQTARPADCIRVMRFKAGAQTAWGTTISFSGPDFFENGGTDRLQWESYAKILGYTGPDAVYDMLDYYFAGRLISEWDRIFSESIVSNVFARFVDSLTIDYINLDLTPARYNGGERVLNVDIQGTTGLKRIDFPDHIVMKSTSATIKSLKGFVVLNIDRMTLGYSTPHFNGYLFRGNVRDDILDDTKLYIPISNEEKRDPRKEDKYLANELITHLNANLEYYNKALWYNLDVDRRYLLLDGFQIQTYDDLNAPSVTRSLASVVKNQLIGIAGNALIFPVAAGVKIDRSYIVVAGENNETRISLLDHYRPRTSPEPYRISVPTRGVYAEAVQGACDACETKKDNSSQDWDKFRTDEPTAIAQVPTPLPAPTDWKAAFKDFAAPIVNIQNAPSEPAPAAGLAGVNALLGNPNLFRDVTGLAGNQSNAMATYLSNQENAKAFAQMAKEMATQSHNTDNSDKIKTAIAEGKQGGALTDKDASDLTKDHIQQMIDGGEGKRVEAQEGKPSLAQAGVDAAAQGKAVKATSTDSSRGTTETLEVNESTPQDDASRTLIILSNADASNRAFGSSTNDKSGKITLSATLNNPPEGYTVHWDNVGTAGGVEIVSRNALTTEVKAIKPGLHDITLSVFNSSGVRVVSTRVKLCVPQFIIVKENAAEFDTALATLKMTGQKNAIIAECKTVAESILSTVNCRLIWQLNGLSETVPASVLAANVTSVTFRNERSPGSGLLGDTDPGSTGHWGSTVFNEAIELYPAAYLASGAAPEIETDLETQALVLQLTGAAAPDPALIAFSVKVFGRLFGETLAHEVLHSLLGLITPGNAHNAPIIPNEIMNPGFTRTFTQRTALVDNAHTSPVIPSNFTDKGIGAINRLQAANQTRIDAVFPVKP